jgi:transcription-repair coupling factor (superfamily II helicase)
MTEFEHAFEYEETPDQKRAIEDVARDMAAPAPMDRIICGDVGYGKTEVAMRAAMRAVADGKQAAVLAPTTVLAFQHLQTFRRRFAPFPVSVEMVSRLRSPAENAEVLARARDGRVDIVIGTHRLLSRDAAFKDLGLVVVDEEQRFGVAAKEKLKLRKTSVDCLTLSATPIPRTLQMGLSGLRDMSVIETPPRDRIAIQTMVVKFSKELIASAIRHELDRDGQVYVVHNRVESIYSLASMIRELVPEANVVVGHGAMSEAELERAMLAFVEGRASVLVATTIVENGLDVPRANTLIVHRADRFGLAQLYQLRGRVGRSDRAAFAYLMVPPGRVLSEIATKRLAAIREFSDLGSGFRLAALDLEMRGAGNLLGGEQSGHILAVGLDLYLKLLSETVRELQTGAPEGGAETRAALNLKLDLRLPADYVPEARDRIAIYKRAADARRHEEVDRLGADLRDRFGPLRPGAEELLDYARARIEAEELGVSRVERSAARLELHFGVEPTLDPKRLALLLSAWPGARFQEGGRALAVPLARAAPVAETRAILARLATAKAGSL